VVFDGTASVKNCTADIDVSVAKIQLNQGYTGTVDCSARAVAVSDTVTIQDGTLTAVGANITLAGALTLQGGAFSAANSSIDAKSDLSVKSDLTDLTGATITVSGTENQAIVLPLAKTLARMDISNTAGLVTLQEGVRATTLDIAQDVTAILRGNAFVGTFKVDAATYLRFKAGGLYQASALDWQGTQASPIRLGSLTAGEAWRLELLEGGTQTITWVDVALSDASSGLEIDGTSSCRNSRGNVNWTFDPSFGLDLPTTSITSPACIEGWTNEGSSSTLKVLADSAEVSDINRVDHQFWYANVPLSASAATAIEINRTDFDDNVEVLKTGSIVWAATTIDADSDQSVLIRKGDSLLLTAYVDGGTNLEIDADGDGTYELSGSNGDEFPVQYATAGFYAVKAKVDGVECGEMTVAVASVDLGNKPFACEVDFQREASIQYTGLSGGELHLGGDNRLDMDVSIKEEVTGGATIYILPRAKGVPTLLARIGGADGPIAAHQLVVAFESSTSATKYITVTETYEDGSCLAEADCLIQPLMYGLDVKMSVSTAGVTFADSTSQLSFTTDEFTYEDEQFRYPYQMLLAPGVDSFCHIIDVWQDGVKVSK
jgi:hypothetical protein